MNCYTSGDSKVLLSKRSEWTTLARTVSSRPAVPALTGNSQFEYTARDTPQQNHLAELGFAVLSNRAPTLMTAANVPLTKRYKIWKEAVKTATLLDELLVVSIFGQAKT